MKARWMCGVALLLVAGMSGASQIELKPRFWMPELSGHFLTQSSGTDPADFDFKKDLMIKDGTFPELRLDWRFGRKTKMNLGYMALDYAGDNPSLGKTFTVNNKPYPANGRLRSSLYSNFYSVGLERCVWNGKRYQVGLVGELKGFMNRAAIVYDYVDKGVARTYRKGMKMPVPIPALGFTLGIKPVKQWTLFANANGITVPKGALGEGTYAYAFDWDAGARWCPDKTFSIEGGFRQIRMHAEEMRPPNDNNITGLNLKGPWVGAGIKF